MTGLRIKETADTPLVILDKETNEFKLSGKSLPEEAYEFYKPLITWLKNYTTNPNPVTQIEVYFEYLNSSSFKQILDLLSLLEKIIKAGKEVKINWKYDADDELMEIKGKELKSMLKIPIELTN